MPWKPAKPCCKPGCGALTGGRFCEEHEKAEREAVDQRRGNSNSRGYGARWRKLRAYILKRDPICRAPGCSEPSTDVDHIIPRGQPGGTDDPLNLQGLCHTHHSRKTAVEDGRWGRRRRA
jgi:5-methylcytosine-specific restriction protein A